VEVPTTIRRKGGAHRGDLVARRGREKKTAESLYGGKTLAGGRGGAWNLCFYLSRGSAFFQEKMPGRKYRHALDN